MRRFMLRFTLQRCRHEMRGDARKSAAAAGNAFMKEAEDSAVRAAGHGAMA